MTTGTTPALPPSRRDPRQLVNTLKKTINWNDTDIALSKFQNSLPLGAFITGIFVEVVTTFDGTTPTLVVGTNSSTYNDLVKSGDVDLGTAGCYEIGTGKGRAVAAAAEKPVYSKATLSSATQGQAVILLTFEGGWGS